jgi:hypothetical protein
MNGSTTARVGYRRWVTRSATKTETASASRTRPSAQLFAIWRDYRLSIIGDDIAVVVVGRPTEPLQHDCTGGSVSLSAPRLESAMNKSYRHRPRIDYVGGRFSHPSLLPFVVFHEHVYVRLVRCRRPSAVHRSCIRRSPSSSSSLATMRHLAATVSPKADRGASVCRIGLFLRDCRRLLDWLCANQPDRLRRPITNCTLLLLLSSSSCVIVQFVRPLDDDSVQDPVAGSRYRYRKLSQ